MTTAVQASGSLSSRLKADLRVYTCRQPTRCAAQKRTPPPVFVQGLARHEPKKRGRPLRFGVTLSLRAGTSPSPVGAPAPC